MVHENSLMLKFEIPTPQFFSVVSRQFQNKVDQDWASVKADPIFTTEKQKQNN